MNYKETLNLPKTDFPMKADLVTREPGRLKIWEEQGLYAQIQEARRLSRGKPVYIFLWPQYHTSNQKLANTFLPGDYWRLELETAQKYADGAVIWCCSNSQSWEDNAAWWLATRSFLKDLESGRR